jgi:hypothetical protein
MRPDQSRTFRPPVHLLSLVSELRATVARFGWGRHEVICNSGCPPFTLNSSSRCDLGPWFRPASFSVVLTRRDTRARLTHREFVIATGHHSRSRTIAPKSLILGPQREIRSKSVSNGEPLLSSSRTSPGWRLTHLGQLAGARLRMKRLLGARPRIWRRSCARRSSAVTGARHGGSRSDCRPSIRGRRRPPSSCRPGPRADANARLGPSARDGDTAGTNAASRSLAPAALFGWIGHAPDGNSSGCEVLPITARLCASY